MAAKNVNFQWYDYTDDDGNLWSARVSTLVGDDATFGFAAFSGTGIGVITMKGRPSMRYATWIDPNTGRTTRTPVGSTAATKWTDPAPTFVGYGKDTTTDITYNRKAKADGKRAKNAGLIVHKPEPA